MEALRKFLQLPWQTGGFSSETSESTQGSGTQCGHKWLEVTKATFLFTSFGFHKLFFVRDFRVPLAVRGEPGPGSETVVCQEFGSGPGRPLASTGHPNRPQRVHDGGGSRHVCLLQGVRPHPARRHCSGESYYQTYFISFISVYHPFPFQHWYIEFHKKTLQIHDPVHTHTGSTLSKQ